MWKLREEILAACLKSGVSVAELEAPVVDGLRGQILAKFTDALTTWPVWIWEHLPDRATLVDGEGWRLIGEFVPDYPTVLLLNPRDETAGFMFPSGKSVATVLADCIGFEVYFTDMAVSYLLIHNHHDCVIGCGEAKRWIEQRVAEARSG